MSPFFPNRSQLPKGQKTQGQQSPRRDRVQDRVSKDPERETQENMKTGSEGVRGTERITLYSNHTDGLFNNKCLCSHPPGLGPETPTQDNWPIRKETIVCAS